MVVRTVLSGPSVITLAKKDILAQTVPRFVHLTVNLTLVVIRTDCVLPALKVGWVIIVPQNVLNRLERIVSIRAITIVSTKRVTDSTGVVCLAVHKEKIVIGLIQKVSN